MKPISSPFSRTTESAGRAFQRVGKVLSVETNPHLAFYKKLQPADFETITNTYGPEATVQYIRAMESSNILGR
jgi:hypothetical protein